jgi:hypothetical protein
MIGPTTFDLSLGAVRTSSIILFARRTFTTQKRNNGADTAYLFKNGLPTEQFFWTHGELSADQAEIIRRHACLTDADWYFNRALSSVFIALQLEWSGTDAVRNVDYWLKAAWKRLIMWHRMVDETKAREFVSRDLVRFPDAEDIGLMLDFAQADEPSLRDLYRRLFRHYKANADVLHAFAASDSAGGRRRAIDRAKGNKYTTQPFLGMLERNFARLQAGA